MLERDDVNEFLCCMFSEICNRLATALGLEELQKIVDALDVELESFEDEIAEDTVVGKKPIERFARKLLFYALYAIAEECDEEESNSGEAC